jgi:hypothetical protein
VSDWRQQEDLVRDDTEDLEPPAALDAQWSGIFDQLIPSVMGERRGLMGQGLRLMVHQGRRYVARNPEQARATVIEAIRMVAAQLRIEPHELYEEVKRG